MLQAKYVKDDTPGGVLPSVLNLVPPIYLTYLFALYLPSGC